ncbi:hypothetical protein F0562_023416 [Nyssa sinensis]|uniref:Uncharacterized protein n=1 Tax=Nyssa sinensis TaxID=561372 RepID=A0A5J5BIJ8_9ASTE|nr:hypothetical protein F0562_023416 [Nyssa sinensis]
MMHQLLPGTSLVGCCRQFMNARYRLCTGNWFFLLFIGHYVGSTGLKAALAAKSAVVVSEKKSSVENRRSESRRSSHGSCVKVEATELFRSRWISHLNKPSLESRQSEPKLIKIRPSFLQRSAGVSVPSSLVRVVPTSCDSHQLSLGRPVMPAAVEVMPGLDSGELGFAVG